jgi:uroporphyrinogen-III decarboxylase
VFWSGSVDHQRTCPSAPAQVREQVRRSLETFGRGGGYVFAAVHNIQAGVPVENLLALFEAVRDYR